MTGQKSKADEWTAEKVRQVYLQNGKAPVELNEFLSREYPDAMNYWGDGLLMPKAITFIGGQAKIGKSMFILDLALSLITGKKFLGFSVHEPRKVLLLQQEISEANLQKRLKVMQSNRYFPRNMLYCMSCKRMKLDSEIGIKRLAKYIELLMPDVVILDPLYKFHSQDENSSSEMKMLFDNLDLIVSKYGIALVIVHHHRKQSGKYGAYQLRGSSTIFDYGDAYLTLNPVARNKLRLDFELRNAENPNPLLIGMNSSLWFEVVDVIEE